ncbi:MAG TPA: flagellar hook capping FlgD N-terminal domain-containing protein [Pirellulaceae bacterium]|nr:flagellar hook capping FlgD N-terminal domain-containing protein [Pirellulaceae bacterium]
MSRISAAGGVTSPSTDRNAGDLRELNLDHFLKLMVTELQNQDPLDPMDNSEILAQISQIRSISATDQLSETLGSVLLGQNMATASGLIGKRINALSDGADPVDGVVDRVTVVVDENNGGSRSLRVHVGEHDVRLDNIREIIEDDPSA